MEKENLATLWLRCVERDREGDWYRLLGRLEPRLRRFVGVTLLTVHWMAEVELIEELTQNVYCRLFERNRRVLLGCRAESTGQLLAYLKRICRSVVVDHFRSTLAKKRGSACEVALSALCTDHLLRRSRSDERLLTRQLRARLRKALAQVSDPSSRARNSWIFERAVVEGWTSREISRRTGLHPSGVDSIIHRMKQRLDALGLRVPNRADRRNPLQARDL